MSDNPLKESMVIRSSDIHPVESPQSILWRDVFSHYLKHSCTIKESSDRADIAVKNYEERFKTHY